MGINAGGSWNKRRRRSNNNNSNSSGGGSEALNRKSVNHVLTCNAYEVAVVNKARTDRLIQKNNMSSLQTYSVHDLCDDDDDDDDTSNEGSDLHSDVTTVHRRHAHHTRGATTCPDAGNKLNQFRLLPSIKVSKTTKPPPPPPVVGKSVRSKRDYVIKLETTREQQQQQQQQQLPLSLEL